MDFDNIPYRLADEPAVVQVLDFDPMEYESYDDQMEITVIELQNVPSSELFLEMADNQWHQMPADPAEDTTKIPSYDSFVRDLIRCETNDFENVANSTTIENSNRKDMCVFDITIECSNDCNCEACLQVYFDAEIRDFDCLNASQAAVAAESIDVDNIFYVQNITNINLVYDFSRIWNEVELELMEYMVFPQQEECKSTSSNVKLLLRNTILMKSNKEENVTAGAAGFYDSSAINSIIDV